MYELIDAATRDMALVTKAGIPVNFVAYVEDAESFSRVVWYNTETHRVFTTNEYGLVADRTQSASDVEFAPRGKPFVDTPAARRRGWRSAGEREYEGWLGKGWVTLLIVSLIILCAVVLLLTIPAAAPPNVRTP